MAMVNFYEILPHWNFITELGQEMCNDDAETQDICAEILYSIGGRNEKQMNKVRIVFS